MSIHLRGLLFALAFSVWIVGLMIVIQGLRRGWGEMSEAQYWTETAVTFLVVALFSVGFSAIKNSRGKRNDSVAG